MPSVFFRRPDQFAFNSPISPPDQKSSSKSSAAEIATRNVRRFENIIVHDTNEAINNTSKTNCTSTLALVSNSRNDIVSVEAAIFMAFSIRISVNNG